MGCASKAPQEPALHDHAIHLDQQQCAVCGMLVADQPVPRVQLLHRDGTRAFLCSASELRPYLVTPSRHGKVRTVFMEALSPKASIHDLGILPRPWTNAQDAYYLLGGPQRKIMGESILVYETRHEAEAARLRLGGHVVNYKHFISGNGAAKKQ